MGSQFTPSPPPPGIGPRSFYDELLNIFILLFGSGLFMFFLAKISGSYVTASIEFRQRFADERHVIDFAVYNRLSFPLLNKICRFQRKLIQSKARKTENELPVMQKLPE